MPGQSEPILYEQEGAIVTVTLNRPEVMNNFGGGLIEGLAAAADRFDADPSAHVMILTGNGRVSAKGDRSRTPRRQGRDSARHSLKTPNSSAGRISSSR